MSFTSAIRVALSSVDSSTAPRVEALPALLDAAGLDAAIARLERDMEGMARRHRDLFSYANAWAVRHDLIVAAAPCELRACVERRLQTLGARWGLATAA